MSFAQYHSGSPRRSWPIAVAAATLGISASSLAYRVAPSTERYTQFTVGSITWRAAAKMPDYMLLAALVTAVCASWAALAFVRQHVDRRFSANDGDEFVSMLGCSVLPAIAWAGANLYGPQLDFGLVHLSLGAVLLCAGATLLLARARVPPASALPFVMTAMLLGGLFLPVLAVGVNRIVLLGGRPPIWRGSPGSMWLIGLGALASTVVALLVTRRSSVGGMRHLVGFLQVPYPWAFLIVLPMPWGDAQAIAGWYPMHWLPAGALALVAIGYVDLVRRWFDRRPGASWPWMQVVSPVCLAAVIIIFRIGVPPAAFVSADDYHFGEALLPWWSWSAHGQVPFRDHVPARGMVNYVAGAVAALLGDGSASLTSASGPVVMAAFFAALMGVTAAFVGTLPAAGMYLLWPISDRINDIEVVLTLLMVAGWYFFFKTSGTRWTVGWFALALAAFLFAPGQAMLFALATFPLLLVQLGRGLLDQPATLGRALLLVLAAVALAAFLTPFGSMLIGAARYVAEHSAVASVAHGVEWRASIGTQGAANYWLFEAIRSSFILVPITSALLLAAAFFQRNWREGARLAVVAVPVLLLGTLYIPRVASRVDPSFASRLGLTSAWMHATLMPTVLWAAWGSRRWPSILAIAMFVLGALSWMVGGMISTQAFEFRAIPSAPRPATLIEGAALGMPALGYADITAAEASRLLRLRQTLDALLDPGETYLDLTNRNAHYFYFDRRVPIESGAIYNLPNEAQQVRAVRRLEAEHVPIVLGFSERYLHDGGPPSLRAHGIYRYVAQRYAPIRFGNDVYLVRPDRIRRASSVNGADSGSEKYALLDEAFAPPPLDDLPLAWGRSWDHLQRDAVQIRALDVEHASDLANLRLPVPIAGRTAGLLLLELSCGASETGGGEVNVSWSGDIPTGMLRLHAGPRLVIPLDASPRWLLARQIAGLQVAVTGTGACSPASVVRAELWQRKIAAMTDPD